MIKRSKCKNKGIVPTEMELVLEYTQQGASHEVSVILRVLRIILVILPEHPSDTKDHLKMEIEMEIPSSSNVKLITECSDTTYTCYEVMKDLIKVSKLPQTLISYSSSQVHKIAINYKMMRDYAWVMISRNLKITIKDKSKMNQKITIPNVQDIKCLRAKD
ncbi:hypothetical protein Tco_0581453 [Tanacetum coccineum]